MSRFFRLGPAVRDWNCLKVFLLKIEYSFPPNFNLAVISNIPILKLLPTTRQRDALISLLSGCELNILILRPHLCKFE